MAVIKTMDELLSNKIAAGEVVEKCVSVVKELVENSCDAKSSKIVIELIDSGTKMIKVTDNGIGMDKLDAVKAFERHATSKLLDEEDLYRITTLGFRGEALPSIASVSEIVLKTSDGNSGTIVNIKGGKSIKSGEYQYKKGTSIEVLNLFYNTPARLKHLSSLNGELYNITEFISKIALSNPQVSFELINNNKTILKTIGNNNLLQTINSIYGLDVTKNMLEINTSNDDYSISGFICKPSFSRSNRNHIITIVNNRIVKNIELTRTIIEAYHTYLLINKYPIVIININVDPSLIDVNIHPTKMDIKFSKFTELKACIRECIYNKLNETNHIRIIEKESDFLEKKEEESVNYKQEELEIITLVKENEEVYEVHRDLPIKQKLPELYVAGSVLGTYIVCENNTGMYLIDQHAAKERINYEKFMKELNNPTDKITDLLIPIKLEFPTSEYMSLIENKKILDEIHINIEEFGYNTIIIKSHPLWININIEEKLKKIIDLVLEIKKDFDQVKFNEKIAITLACKLSIKANDTISNEEAIRLIKDLEECENPYNCPHGRPTIINFSKYEIEKMFKRINN